MARVVRVLEYYGDSATIHNLIHSGVIAPEGGTKIKIRDAGTLIVYSHLLPQTGNGYVESCERQRNTPSNNQKTKRGRKNAKRKGPTNEGDSSVFDFGGHW